MTADGSGRANAPSAGVLREAPTESALDDLIRVLGERGYDVIGPRVRDGAVMLGPVRRARDLPRDVGDAQEKGGYRLTRTGDGGFFGHNAGPMSWKSFLFPEKRRLWRLTRDGEPEGEADDPRPFAFLGVRACDWAAIRVQDRVFMRDGGDPHYRRRRAAALVIGVQCRTAAATCFCPSMGTGPEFPESGWDLLLTEDGDRLLMEAGSARGQEILDQLSTQAAHDQAREVIRAQAAATRAAIHRRMDQDGIKERIYEAIPTHDWGPVGARCLACANCTLVCPTCFCSTVHDVSDVADATAERWQTWDSCFHLDFSYVHGGSRRVSTASRYRQWFTHKLATWHDQFGTSGCVGCGRCIAWCPVGIDITEEMAAIRAEAPASPPGAKP